MQDADDADASATFMNKYEIRLAILSLIFMIIPSSLHKITKKNTPMTGKSLLVMNNVFQEL